MVSANKRWRVTSASERHTCNVASRGKRSVVAGRVVARGMHRRSAVNAIVASAVNDAAAMREAMADAARVEKEGLIMDLQTDAGYLTFDERDAYRDGIGRANENRRLFGLQGVMRDVRRAVVDVRHAKDATLLGAQSISARVAVAFAAGMTDAALAIVQRQIVRA